MKTTLVLDALEQALWAWRRDGTRDLAGLVHHTAAGRRAHLLGLHRPGPPLSASGLLPSMGSIGDSHDNAMIESFWGRVQTGLLS